MHLREDEEFIEMGYEAKMEWFKEEFKLSFGIPSRDTIYSDKDRQLYQSLINKMTETINQEVHEPLFYKLTDALNEILKIYDEYMEK